MSDPTKFELVGYLSGLISILDSMDDAARPRSTTLSDEYQRAYLQLKEIIQKEQEDETRDRQQQSQRDETRTDVPSGEPRRSGSTRTSDGQTSRNDPAIRGPRLRST